MRKTALILVAFAMAAAPATAQTAPPGQTESAPAPVQKVVKKVVCQKIEEDRATGSRLGSTSKVCRTVKVPVDSSAEKGEKSGPSSAR